MFAVAFLFLSLVSGTGCPRTSLAAPDLICETHTCFFCAESNQLSLITIGIERLKTVCRRRRSTLSCHRGGWGACCRRGACRAPVLPGRTPARLRTRNIKGTFPLHQVPYFWYNIASTFPFPLTSGQVLGRKLPVPKVPNQLGYFFDTLVLWGRTCKHFLH